MAKGGESRFFVHHDILTSQSQPFRDALSGEWQEATKREVILRDWDGATVGRMVEFLYWGTYRYPDPVPISPGVETPGVESGAVTSGSSKSSGKSQTFTASGLTPPAGANMMSCRLAGPEGNVNTILERLKRFDPARHDYGETLLSHSKIYQLAHYKAIDPLRAQALECMRHTLSRIDKIDPATGSHNITRIVALTRDIYRNTDPLENHKEPLRSVTSHFIARNFAALRSSLEMMDFLSKGGEIVMDVMAILSAGPSMACPELCPATRYISRILVSSCLLRSAFVIGCHGNRLYRCRSFPTAPRNQQRATTCKNSIGPLGIPMGVGASGGKSKH